MKLLLQLNLKILCNYVFILPAKDSDDGWTALMYSKYYKHRKIENILIERGADINIMAYDGTCWSTLLVACDIAKVNIKIKY